MTLKPSVRTARPKPGFIRPATFSAVGTLLLIVGLVAAFCAGPAGAVVDSEQFRQFGSEGSAAGQLMAPHSIATGPSGEVYVADDVNFRVNEFTAWGVFVKAWGWGVKDGAKELQTCTSSCRAGLRGTGAGQFHEGAWGIAVDALGNVYVDEIVNHRVQKFDPTAGPGEEEAEFVLMFGGGVSKVSGDDICTAAEAPECGAGSIGSGPGEFSEGYGIAIGPLGALFIGGQNRIQSFEPNGSLSGEIKVPGRIVNDLTFRPDNAAFYAGFQGEAGVHELDLSGAEVGGPEKFTVPFPESLAVGEAGEIYVVDGRHTLAGGLHYESVLEFDPSGNQIGQLAKEGREEEDEGDLEASRLDMSAVGTNTAGDLYIASRSNFNPPVGAFIRAYGPPPLKYGPPPKVPPTIVSQFVASGGSTSFELKAQINPHFWAEAIEPGAETTYYLEYGAQDCALGGCAKQPSSAPPGIPLGAGPVEEPVAAPVEVSNLAPGTTYHYRFVAQSGGGGPVFGSDQTFTTLASAVPQTNCANQVFRTNASALLPDCRAYEMVSPVDKTSGDILTSNNVTGFQTRLNQSSIGGERLAYSSYRAFGGASAAPYTSEYIATRSPTSGWSTVPLVAPRTAEHYEFTWAQENEFKAFSEDLCEAWHVRGAEPQLAPNAIKGFPNLYRRQNCTATAGYEALTTVEPPSDPPRFYVPDLQGHSADGTKAIFRVNDKLTPDATGGGPPKTDANAGVKQLYEASGGQLKFVCILPDGSPFAESCSAGSTELAVLGQIVNAYQNRSASVHHAMSEDGSRIYWSTSDEAKERGKIYLRLDGATTVKVSETQSTKPCQFWGAAADGSGALFSVTEGPKAGNLYLFSLESESSSLIAGKVIGVAAAGEDLSYVYFASEESIGGKGTAGKANLYVSHEGTTTFIATLSSEDVQLGGVGGVHGQIPSDVALEAIFHAAQVSPDGRRLAFISTSPLTGFDNTDAASEEADSEVFTYAADSGKLSCASCSPVGARPIGRNINATGNSGFLWTAASIPSGENQLYTPRVISEDGNRVFFTSYADLLPGDRNGKADVYEWELPGAGESCKGESDPNFSAANGGCLFLISTGQSPQDSEFVDASGDGKNVFFGTQQRLLPQDPGLRDIYDARVEGGFPAAAEEAVPCNPDGLPACQEPPSPPAFQAPVTSKPGPGNPPLKKPIKCPKGKHRVIKGGKEHCAKNKSKAHKHKGKKKATKHKSGRQGR